MNEKQLKIFAGVFVLLLIIAIFTRPRDASVDFDEFVKNVVIGVSKEDVSEIEIIKETGDETKAQMIFRKDEDDTWRILTRYNCKAKKSSIDRILDDLFGMTGDVRTDDPKHFDKFQIGDLQGIHLQLKDAAEKTMVNLIIGKRGEGIKTGFVRFSDKNKVYAVDKNILGSLGVYGSLDTLSEFKDKSFVDLLVVDENKDDLKQVVLSANGKEMKMQKVEREVEEMAPDSTLQTKKVHEWVLVKGKREIDLDQKEVDRFFREVAKIRVSEVVGYVGPFTDVRQYGLHKRPTHYILLTPEEGAQKNILFGKAYEKDKGHYMYLDWEKHVCKLAENNYKKIWKWINEPPKKKQK